MINLDTGYSIGWDPAVQSYLVKVKEGKAEHFKMAARSFDGNVKIKSVVDGFEIKTTMDENDILSLTSVKSLKKLDQYGSF